MSPVDTTAKPEAEPKAEHAAVRAAVEMAPRLVAGSAATALAGVDAASLAPLAAAGLYGLDGPSDLGGASPAVRRRVAEVLAGADPQLWFVWYQHNPVVKMLATSDNTALADVWLPRLCAGEAYGGVAFSHLRSAVPSVRAEAVDGGWRLTGRQPWCTGWGLTDVVLVGAVTAAGDALFALVPTDAPGLASAGELPLAVMEGTHTVALGVEDLIIPASSVLLLTDYATWLAGDRTRNANVQPSTFGVASAALDELDDRAVGASSDGAGRPARQLREELERLRGESYDLLDEVPPEEQVSRRLELRAEALSLAMTAATAVVVAGGGGALGAGRRGEQLLRAAAFQLVHSQDATVRAATLDVLTSGSRLGGGHGR